MFRTLLLVVLCFLGVRAVAAPIDSIAARQHAQSFLASLSSAKGAPACRSQVLRLAHTQRQHSGLPAFYVYRIDGGGFVIASADSRARRVLGYAPTGDFDATTLPPALTALLAHYTDEIAQLSAAPTEVASAPAVQPLPTLADTLPDHVKPLLGRTQWDQDYPYYNFCPEANGMPTMAGCVAIAVSQIMRSHQWPQYGKGEETYVTSTLSLWQNVNYDGHEYRWDLMRDNYQTSSFNREQADAVAQLIHDVGVAVHMDYTSSASRALSERISAALADHFGYDRSSHLRYADYFTGVEWHNMLRAELAAGRALYYTGSNTNDYGSHAFVCDGYMSGDLFHFNWGWSGLADAYYALSALNPGEQGIGGSSSDYTREQIALFGLQPDKGMSPTPAWLVYYNGGISAQSASGGGGDYDTQLVLHGSYSNKSDAAFNGDLGVILTNHNTGTQGLLTISKGYNLDPYGLVWDYPTGVPAEWVAPGITYEYAYRHADSDTWLPLRARRGEPASILARLSGGQLIFEPNAGRINLTVTATSCLTPNPHPGQPVTLRFTVYNKGEEYMQPLAYKSPLRLMVFTKDSKGYQPVAQQSIDGINFPSGAQTLLDVTLPSLPESADTYYVALGYCAPSSYYLLMKEEGTTHIAMATVEATAAVAPELSITSLEATACVEGQPATFSALVSNTGTDYAGHLRLTLTPVEGESLTHDTPEAIHIYAMTTDLEAQFEIAALPEAGLYTATVDYEDAETQTWLPLTQADGTPFALSVEVQPDLSGVTTVTAQPADAPAYDLSGRPARDDEKNIRIRSGRKQL